MLAKVLVSVIHFNSIKVRLKPGKELTLCVDVDHFNSIKVRLKRLHFLYPHCLTEFQFHKGTIKTVLLQSC